MTPKEQPAAEPIIQVQDLAFSYGKRTILDRVSVSFDPGSFSVIAGESGSGKSTLLYILGGFLKPDSGIYKFRDRVMYRGWTEFGLGRFRKNNIGFLFQDFRLLPFLTVEQNIRFPALFSGTKLDNNAVKRQMERLGIAHRAKAYPNAISGGEAQRTALARALLLSPPVLLLDEPTGNLDSTTEGSIVSVLESLKNEGLTLICISHSKYIMEKADKVWRIDNGKLALARPKKQQAKKRKTTGNADDNT